eukprot:scaffold21082_cov23-Tisochrysis_lutea.AAC.1
MATPAGKSPYSIVRAPRVCVSWYTVSISGLEEDTAGVMATPAGTSSQELASGSRHNMMQQWK